MSEQQLIPFDEWIQVVKQQDNVKEFGADNVDMEHARECWEEGYDPHEYSVVAAINLEKLHAEPASLVQYQELAARTCPDLGSPQLNIAHMVMGLFSEINELTNSYTEFDRVNTGEELADIEWYLANLARMCSISYDIISMTIPYPVPQDMDPTFLINTHTNFLVDNLSKLTDIFKKYVAYGRDWSAYPVVDKMADVFRELEMLYKLNGLDGTKCRTNNINKLKVRYPDKFTNERALDRDLGAERTELEK